MAKDVNLLSYWIPILRNLKEFKQIAIAEEPELIYILGAVDSTLANMFIETADEYGIGRFEKMMGIYPKEGATLEERRFTVQIKWNEKNSYTLRDLENQLTVLLGADGFTLNMDYNNYTLSVKLSLANESMISTVADLLDRVVPANIVIILTLFNTHGSLTAYTHEYLSNYTQKQVREDVL